MAQVVSLSKTKVCTECGKTRTLASYSHTPHTKDGYCHRCKFCAHKARRRSTMARRGHQYIECDDHEKQCTRCGKVKPKTEFHHNKATYDKRTSACATCMNARDRSGNGKPKQRSEPRPAASEKLVVVDAERIVDGHGAALDAIAQAMMSAGIARIEIDDTGKVSAKVEVFTHVPVGGNRGRS